MTKNFLILISLILSNLVFGQTTQAESKIYKHKRVKRIIETEYASEHPSTTIVELNEEGQIIVETRRIWNLTRKVFEIDVSTYEYDENGNLTHLQKKNNELSNLWFIKSEIYKYEYDINNRINTKNEITKNGETKHEVRYTFEYDQNGNNTKTNMYNSSDDLVQIREYKFDSLNLCIEDLWIPNTSIPMVRHTYKYNEKNQLIEKCKFKSNALVYEPNNYTTYYSYNKKGLLSSVSDESGEIKREYKYYKNGLMKKLIVKGSHPFYRTYLYEYY